jgi:hypothetical protein
MRFLRAHWTPLQRNPFDVYHYAGLAPLSSIFRRINSNSSCFPYSVTLIGSEPDWPSEIIIQPHKIETYSFSPCGNWLATGGISNNGAVFAVWDINTAGGTTNTHPCGGSGCSTYYIAFDRRKDAVELRTRCHCEKLYIWDISTTPITLLQEVWLKSKGSLKWWANDFSKAISERVDPTDHRTFITALIDGNETCKQDLGCFEPGSRWMFSPGTGEKVFGWSEYQLHVFESSSGRRCFHKRTRVHRPRRFDHVRFSPSGKSILYSVMDRRDTSHNGVCAITLVNSNNGAQIWSQSIHRAYHIDFFPDGDRILVGTGSSLSIMGASGACIKQYSLLNPRSVSISPEKGRIAVTNPEGVEILDSTSLNRIEWYPWSKPVDREIIQLSWNHSTIIKIDHQGLADQSITFFNLTSSKLSQVGAPFETKSTISNIFLSPNGSRLLIRDENGQFRLWCTSSGAQVDLIGDDIDKFESDFHIKYTPDSSSIIIWGGTASKVAVVDTKDGRVRTTNLVYAPNIPNAYPFLPKFFPFHEGYSANFIFPNDKALDSLGKVSIVMGSISDITFSLKAPFIALIGKRKGIGMVSVVDYRITPQCLHLHLCCSGPFEGELGPTIYEGPAFISLGSSLGAKEREQWEIIDRKAEFVSNGTDLFVLEKVSKRGCLLSMIKTSNTSLKGFTVAKFVENPKRELQGPLSLELTVINRHQFFKTTPLYQDVLFDCSNGRMITSPAFCGGNNGLYYGEHRLPISHISMKGIYKASERNIVYVNEDGKIVVVNYSGYIDHM